MRKPIILLLLLILFLSLIPMTVSADEEEYNDLGIKIGTEVYGEDISKLSEEELQYIPKGWRDGNFESEHPVTEEEESSNKVRMQSIFPNVNNYIKALNVPSVEYQHNHSFEKFNYRNGHGAVEGVVAHETANDNSTINQEILFMARNHENAFVHAFIDHNRIVEIHPLDLGAWGAGRYANQRFVHVELVRVNNFDQFARSINNYSDYIANVLYDYNLGVTSAENSGKGTLWSHKAVSKFLGATNHVDPHGYFARYGYDWNQFVRLVSDKYKKIVPSNRANTSQLGKIKSHNARIYKDPTNLGNYSNVSNNHLNRVYYIKAEAKINGTSYHLISTKPSSKTGVVGWIRGKDLTTYSHHAVDNKSKTFYFKGKGVAYNRAWGGSKNIIYNSNDLKELKHDEFKVHKTETVGNNTWYRGTVHGKTIWIHSSHVEAKEEKKTSRLGKVKNDNVKIYQTPEDKSTASNAGSTFTNKVFYIKKQSKLAGQTYYLISTKPSSVNGTIGWVNSKDITTYSHKAVDNKSKSFYFKGKGAAYNRAWGGSKNKIYNSNDLANFKYQEFKVHKTETVGNNTWYRGTHNGKTLWIHSNHLTTKEENNTSKLGKVKSKQAVILKKIDDPASAIEAGESYTNGVYYIKKQVKINGLTYYLISTKPSSVNGTIGWVNSKDVTTYSHKAIDNKSKTFYFKGKGAAYNRAWGGSKNKIYDGKDLANFKYQEFKVHKTETVGNNTWYRGTHNGKTIWIHSNHLTTKEEGNTSRLGKVKNKDTEILKKIDDPATAFSAGATYMNAVYYIKKYIKVNGQTFYLISTKPSSINGTIGWVNAKDITTYSHLAVDNKEKTFYLKGKGAAYNRAWGGSENKIYDGNDLAELKGEKFFVHKTETVGNNTWYRGVLGNKTLWIHNSHLSN